jgi:hypothetical protein
MSTAVYQIPDDDTGKDICPGYDDDCVEDRSGVIEWHDLDFEGWLRGCGARRADDHSRANGGRLGRIGCVVLR